MGVSYSVAEDLPQILSGLSQPQKSLPAKLFYDPEGCRLFGEITRLPEYYPTRTECALLRSIGPELPFQPDCALVEYGASDEAKAALILDAVGAGIYIPVDVAAEALTALQARLGQVRPKLLVCPVVADFLQLVSLPSAMANRKKIGFFPGSTIGNLTPGAAITFLTHVRQALGPASSMIVGVDLQKPLSTLIPAYDDAQGVTAAFNRNILTHLNRAFGAQFDVDQFAHLALWNDREHRIEMHLRSRKAQSIKLAGISVPFAQGETIHTENSYKYTVTQFQTLARDAGWVASRVWTDTDELFSVHLLTA